MNTNDVHFWYRHEFAVWAGARASQRGFTTIKNLKNALECSGVVDFLLEDGFEHTTRENFDCRHDRWCLNIIGTLKKSIGDRGDVTYGRAAKLIAVYLKSMILMTEYIDTPIAWHVHPPIDRILLQNLAKETGMKKIKSVVWTALDRENYLDLIGVLRKIMGDESPLWVLDEKYWKI